MARCGLKEPIIIAGALGRQDGPCALLLAATIAASRNLRNDGVGDREPFPGEFSLALLSAGPNRAILGRESEI
jgi:hypothetical protein